MSSSPRPPVAGPLPPATPAGPGGAPVRDPRSLDHLTARYHRYAELVGAELRAWLSFHLPRPGRSGSVAGAGRALDAGCGTGAHTTLLADRFTEVLAVDISGPMVDYARGRRPRGNVRYEVRDLRSVTPSMDGLFDAIVCAHTLHYVGDVARALWRLRSVVRPGGTVLLVDVVDERGSPSRAWLRRQAWTRFVEDIHRHRRPVRQAAELLRLSLDCDWLDHESTDRLLMPGDWHAVVRAVFPGATLATFDRAHALSWTAPRAEAGCPDSATRTGARTAGAGPAEGRQ